MIDDIIHDQQNITLLFLSIPAMGWILLLDWVLTIVFDNMIISNLFINGEDSNLVSSSVSVQYQVPALMTNRMQLFG